MARRPRRSAEETRAEILSRAEDLFRADGYAKTSIADIAAALGMSPANVFKHFSSKMALVEAIAATHLERIEHSLDSISAQLDPPDRLRRFGETLLAGHLENMQGSPHVFEMVALMMTMRSPVGATFEGRLQRRVQEILEDGNLSGDFLVSDPAEAALTVLDCLAGTTHPLLITHADPARLEDRLTLSLELLIAGLRRGLD